MGRLAAVAVGVCPAAFAALIPVTSACPGPAAATSPGLSAAFCAGEIVLRLELTYVTPSSVAVTAVVLIRCACGSSRL
jgi:hypothetical protein